MSYITVKNFGEDSFEEKKSEFIGYAKRVESEEEAKEFVAEIKNKHKQARHNCWAYIVGENMGIQRYSDDGEPQGTAGIPILEVMKKQGITDCAVVVTRYFGGILLGTGGLTRAYTQGASIAIKSAGVIEKVKGIIVEQLGVAENAVTMEASFIDDLGADSLDIVELVMALEEEFDIEIPDSDAEKVVTVEDVVEYIKENVK